MRCCNTYNHSVKSYNRGIKCACCRQYYRRFVIENGKILCRGCGDYKIFIKDKPINENNEKTDEIVTVIVNNEKFDWSRVLDEDKLLEILSKIIENEKLVTDILEKIKIDKEKKKKRKLSCLFPKHKKQEKLQGV